MTPSAKPDPTRYEDRDQYYADYAAWHAGRITQARAELGEAECYGDWVITDRRNVEPECRVLTCRRSGTGWNPREPDRGGSLGPEDYPGRDLPPSWIFPPRYVVRLEILGNQPLRVMSREEWKQEREEKQAVRKAKKTAKREAAIRSALPLFAGLADEPEGGAL